MNDTIIEFLIFEQVLLVRIKNLFTYYANSKLEGYSQLQLAKKVIENLHFSSNLADILPILATHGIIILTKFHNLRTITVDFSLIAIFWRSRKFWEYLFIIRIFFFFSIMGLEILINHNREKMNSYRKYWIYTQYCDIRKGL